MAVVSIPPRSVCVVGCSAAARAVARLFSLFLEGGAVRFVELRWWSRDVGLEPQWSSLRERPAEEVVLAVASPPSYEPQAFVRLTRILRSELSWEGSLFALLPDEEAVRATLEMSLIGAPAPGVTVRENVKSHEVMAVTESVAAILTRFCELESMFRADWRGVLQRDQLPPIARLIRELEAVPLHEVPLVLRGAVELARPLDWLSLIGRSGDHGLLSRSFELFRFCPAGVTPTESDCPRIVDDLRALLGGAGVDLERQ